MSDMIETVREKAHSKGFKDGVIAERLQTIGLLQRIGASADLEGALHAEHEKLLALQAREAAALAATDVNARRVFSSTDEQLAFFERINTPGGAAPSGALDNGDLVAAAMGLTMPEKPTPATTSGDDADRVAPALFGAA